MFWTCAFSQTRKRQNAHEALAGLKEGAARSKRALL